jgi:hypothetical protein
MLLSTVQPVPHLMRDRNTSTAYFHSSNDARKALKFRKGAKFLLQIFTDFFVDESINCTSVATQGTMPQRINCWSPKNKIKKTKGA